MILPSQSLAGRLAWRLALVVIAAITLAAVAVGWRSIAAVRGLDDTALQDQARAIAAHLSAGPDGQPVLSLSASMATAFHASRGNDAFVITGGTGVLLASDPGAWAALAASSPAHPGLFRVAPSRHHPSGMLGYALDAGRWRVIVAQGREQSEALVRSVVEDLLSTGLALLAVVGSGALLVAVWTVRQGLRPVRDASAAAAAIGPARPGARLPETELPAEIAPLVRAMNHALARLEAALAAQRRFVGDAAHTLRTPLAVLVARLDSLPDSAATQALHQDADRMVRLVTQMLEMARIDGAPLDVTSRVDLHAVAREAISALAPLALQRDLDLILTGAAAEPIRGNHAALVVALQNLIENALGYAPSGSAVEVELAPASLRVLDRGRGVAEAERETIFRRFQRGGGRGRSNGAGLGLAIVSEIAAAHHGSVRAVARDGGGAVFMLLLGTDDMPPLAASDHRQNEVLPMQPARHNNSGEMHTDQA